MMSFISVVSLTLTLLAIYSFNLTTSFTARPSFYLQSPFHRQKASCHIGLLPELGTSTWIALDVFDGSGVDPIVVSNVFWASLQAKLLSVIIGQLFATVVFGIVASFAASQLSTIGEFVTETIFKEQNDVQQRIGFSTAKQTSSKVTPDVGKLILCIVIDVIGTSSELIPIAGELTDLAWAPIAAIALRSIYGSNIIFALEFVEEILPFTDILPLATLCWVVDTYFGDTDIAKALGIGNYSRNVVDLSDPGIIDVESETNTAVPTTSYARRLPTDTKK